MAWPQDPQPAPPSTATSSLSIGPLVTAAAAVLTFLFSFVRIAKVGTFGPFTTDVGWSVWTVDGVPPGLFGVGTSIPLLALVAGGAALAGAFGPGLRDRSLGGFTLLQVQQVAAGFAALLWLGYLVGIVLGDTEMGLGLVLLFFGLVGVGAGTVLTVIEAGKATAGGAVPPAGGAGPWTQPAPPASPVPDPGTWQQQQPPQPPVDPASGSWPQPPAPASGSWPAPPPPDPGTWQPPPPPPPPTGWDQTSAPGAAAAPGGWQQPGPRPSDPYAPQPGSPGPVPEPGPLDPQPAPPVDPQPEPAPAPGFLPGPGTQVIPGPPPAPPADGDTESTTPPPPPPPPPNT